MRAIFRFSWYNSNCLIGKSPRAHVCCVCDVFSGRCGVVEILVETVPFSLIVALGNVVLAAMIVAFVAAGAYAWTQG